MRIRGTFLYKRWVEEEEPYETKKEDNNFIFVFMKEAYRIIVIKLGEYFKIIIEFPYAL